MPAIALSQQALPFEIRFRSLSGEGSCLIFPCDEAGRVDLDGLNERARWNYLFAHAMIGREYAKPSFYAA